MPRATAEQVNNACINIDGEEWRDIVDYEGIYQVSNLGRIKHLPTTIVEVASTGEVVSTRMTREYILKHSINRQDYLVVGLTKNGKTSVVGLHRIIALAFVPRLPNQTEVHHIDRNRQNNSLNNLQWVTTREHIDLHRDKPRKEHDEPQ